jgi:hypothetical protein
MSLFSSSNKSQKSLTRFFPYFLIGGAIFLLGWLIGHFGWELKKIELKREVSLDEVFNFVMGLVVAILLQFLWAKNYGAVRVEKDLYQSRLAKLEAKTDRAFDTFNRIYIDERNDSNNRRRPEVQKEFNVLVLEVDSARNLLDNLSKKLKDLDNCFNPDLDELRHHLVVFKSALTLKEYHELYDEIDFEKAKEHFDNMNEHIFSLMLMLNKL